MTPRVELPDLPGWSALSRGDLHVVVRAGGAVVDRITAAAQDGDVDEVLDALAQDGLRRAPDFVVVLATEPVRVVARGTAYAVLTTPTGQLEVRAPARGPWADEDGPADVGTVELRTGDEGPDALDVPSSPTPVEVAAADATTPPPADPDRADGGGGWRRPALFGRLADAAPTTPPAPAPPTTEPATTEPATTEPTTAGTPVVEEPDELPSYDHLFGATQHDRPAYIEQHDTGTIEEPPLGHSPIEAIGGYDPTTGAGTADGTLAPPAHTMAPPPAQVPASDGRPPAAPAPGPEARQGAIIDSVPWRSGGSNVPAPEPVAPTRSVPTTPPPASPPAAAPPRAPLPARVAPPTVTPPAAPTTAPPTTALPPAPPTARPAAAPAAVPPPPATPPPATGAPGPASDDVEATVDRSALLERGALEAGPQVLAVLCPAGHSSPPHSGVCRQCGRDIPPQQPFQTARPPLGVLRLPDGDLVVLDRGVLLGRSPRVNAELDAAARPHLVKVTSPQNDISRNHVEIVLEGWHVLIRDLSSTNGTTVALPGQPPVRLRPSDQQVLEPGAVITLADEVAISFEVQE